MPSTDPQECPSPGSLSTQGFFPIDENGNIDLLAITSFGWFCGSSSSSPFEKFALPIKYSESDYFQMINNLLPRGVIWEGLLDILGGIVTNTAGFIFPVTDRTNLFKRLLSCFSAELTRFEILATEAQNQTVVPGLSTLDGLLSRWEKLAGLPDECVLTGNPTLSEQDRQRQAHAKIINGARTITKELLIDYAAELGWDIDITETQLSTSAFITGVAITGVNVVGGSTSVASPVITINSGPTDLTVLQCAFDRIKPAHMIFNYTVA